MQVLIAIDNSEYSKEAIDSILNRPWSTNAKFLVITVIEPVYPEYVSFHANYGHLSQEVFQEISKSANALVAETVNRFKQSLPNNEIKGQVLEGFAKEEILQSAKECNADLIILGSHGRKGINKFLLGSVSEAVASHSPCSVEIVKTKKANLAI